MEDKHTCNKVLRFIRFLTYSRKELPFSKIKFPPYIGDHCRYCASPWWYHVRKNLRWLEPTLNYQGDLCFVHLFVQLGQRVARHSLSSLGPQQPVEILDHVLAIKLCSLPVRDQYAATLHHLHKHIITTTRSTHNYKNNNNDNNNLYFFGTFLKPHVTKSFQENNLQNDL